MSPRQEPTITQKANRLLEDGLVEERPVRYFEIDSGSGAPYRVSAFDAGEGAAPRWLITCDCKAGEHGKKCYHACAVLMILRGEAPANERVVYLSPTDETGDYRIAANRVAQNWRRLVVVPKSFELTDLERRVLANAAGAVEGDIDRMGYLPSEKAAYTRALNKIRGR